MSVRGQHKQRYPMEWERERIAAWMKIVKVDPLDTNKKSTIKRMREFESRYARLEEKVPTP